MNWCHKDAPKLDNIPYGTSGKGVFALNRHQYLPWYSVASQVFLSLLLKH